MSTALNTVKKFFPKVKSVVDATTPTLIEVTKKDTESKAVKNHSACAMAVACKRKFKLDGVIVSRSIAYLIKGNKARRFLLPASVSREIVSFDRGAGFQPGTYQLERVTKSLQLGPGHPQKIKNRDAKIKQFRHITTHARSVLGGQQPLEEGE
jgi:hypothetical protein